MNIDTPESLESSLVHTDEVTIHTETSSTAQIMENKIDFDIDPHADTNVEANHFPVCNIVYKVSQTNNYTDGTDKPLHQVIVI